MIARKTKCVVVLEEMFHAIICTRVDTVTMTRTKFQRKFSHNTNFSFCSSACSLFRSFVLLVYNLLLSLNLRVHHMSLCSVEFHFISQDSLSHLPCSRNLRSLGKMSLTEGLIMQCLSSLKFVLL